MAIKVKFSIHYNTSWGEQLLVTGNTQELGKGVREKALRLNYMGQGLWQGEVVLKSRISGFTYSYLVLNEPRGEYKEEWSAERSLQFVKNLEQYACYDSWNEGGSVENVYMTSPFQRVWYKNSKEEGEINQTEITHLFRVKAPGLKSHHALCLLGSENVLGNWETRQPVLMNRRGETWFLEKEIRTEAAHIYYKYGVYDTLKHEFLHFEQGENRMAPVVADTLVQMDDGFVRVAHDAWRAAGVGLPVFSIRTRSSFGVGDFVDIKALVDWSAHVGLKLIQVLPLNDTIGTHTELDVLPYAAISAFALNPLYLNLPALGSMPETGKMRRQYRPKQAELNNHELVPFMEVINFKLAYAREAFDYQKKEFREDSDFRKFFKKNGFWLQPYAAFCVLRDRYGTNDYTQWADFSFYDKEKIDLFTAENGEYFEEILFHYYLQYHLHKQLYAAGVYANQNGVVLKGDIPIGVNKNSADTWANPELFHLDRSAGAPPDMFAVKGQNWSLPTYNWEAMRANGYRWWKQRFEHMSGYFDTFRIDHILGFFRIWEIPNEHIEGIMGHLNPSVPIYLHEFEEKGIQFDYNRFCKPYITDSVLNDFFGQDAHWIRSNCLQIEDGWILRLKPEYSSQTFVAQMASVGVIPAHLEEPLLDLISNVLLFEKEGSGGKEFYPRYGMHFLRSYAELDDHSKRGLDELYIDYYYRRQDAGWFRSGMEKLPAMKRATNMLICGEDLGMMNPAVTAVMKELGILSLEVQRAPKSDEIEFAHPQYAPYLSVVTPATHDMTTIRGWWEEDRELTQRFYNNQLGRGGEAPYFCEWWVARDIILQHLYSPAMLAVFQWQDLMAMSDKLRRESPQDERINDPSNSEASWRYRMHISLDNLMSETEFNDTLREFIRQTGR